MATPSTHGLVGEQKGPFTRILSETTSNPSLDGGGSMESVRKPSALRRIGQRIVQRAKEHHESVNAASAAYHGQPAFHRATRTNGYATR
ncbi:uncharacterized protein L3040_002994 [Drepanopeziza brunnea f. sp. 'multigermtubi']|uniref:uncharacterized protein n=1 Tax=Drepanopeziza brunnea f. sp. 'multigermtubi' TaxID=698441 RepID=UPI00238230EE|nr:hypothetical protein L3040_002994 [Drepanopeziza brunnea f. sp. 'multigermtubi']